MAKTKKSREPLKNKSLGKRFRDALWKRINKQRKSWLWRHRKIDKTFDLLEKRSKEFEEWIRKYTDKKLIEEWD